MQDSKNRLFYALLGLFIFILAVRLISLGLYPLMNTTEARYAEMSRKILELNEWVVLYYYDYETPFWGKPPLSFWASAASMWLFGVNEFGARFAPFVFGILTCAVFLAWKFGDSRGLDSHNSRDSVLKTRQESPFLRPLACSIVLFTTGVGFVASGAVMTDEALLFCVALCMVCFWRCVWDCGDSRGFADSNGADSSECAKKSAKKRRIFGYGFWLGIALGLLAKGPLIIVLAGLPIVAFLGIVKFLDYCESRDLGDSRQDSRRNCAESAGFFGANISFRYFPILGGLILTALIAIPWYVAFEVKAPGFLEYFLVGEHFKRFFISGWEGSLYGQAHREPIGTIWWFFALSFLPWNAVLLGFVIKKIWGLKIPEHGKIPALIESLKSPSTRENLYLWLWLLMPLCFLTFSRNILEAYTLPCAPAFCIILVNFIFAANARFGRRIWLLPLALMLIVSAFLTTGKLDDLVNHRHTKDVFTRWDGKGRLVFIDDKPSFSGYFYAHQTSKAPLKDEFLRFDDPQVREILHSNERVCIAIRPRDFEKHKDAFANFRQIVAKKDWILLQKSTNF